MGLCVKIKSEGLEMELPENVVRSYKFKYDIEDVYAKTYPSSVGLILELNISELLSSEAGTVEENEEMLKKIREWGAYAYGDNGEPDEEYYRAVHLTHTFGEEVFRGVELNYAYVERFSEAIDAATGRHMVELELQQEEDSLSKIGSLLEVQ